MPSRHSSFSPSSSDRFIHCPPSLKLGEEYGPEDTSSVYTREGTEAHEVCEFLLRRAIGDGMDDPRPGLEFYNEEMQSSAETYRDMVLELFEELRKMCTDPFISVEQEVSFEEYVPGGFGTSDTCLIGDGKMFIVDFKYGKGVEVSAEDNSQLKCYALGCYLAFAPLYEINDITLVIIQPRIGNYSRWSLTAETLLSWAENTLKPAAEMALHGEGDFASGAWCRFCKAKAVCRKRAEENLALARYDFARPPVLEDDEVNVILSRIDDLIRWAEDIRSYALGRALTGYSWDDWKVVEGRANRRFTDEEAVAEKVSASGFDPYTRKLRPLTEMEKLLGKKQFNDLLGDLVEKPAGKPTLVSRADPRPEIAQTDFLL